MPSASIEPPISPAQTGQGARTANMGTHRRFNATSAIAAMLESMGDHEYHCASYAGKDQPHISGLLMTLADGLRAKEKDILVAKEAGEHVEGHEIARQILHRLLSRYPALAGGFFRGQKCRKYEQKCLPVGNCRKTSIGNL